MIVTMHAADFVRGVTSVLACASDDRTMPNLSCVRLDWNVYGVVFAATNRYVYGEQTVASPDYERGPGGVSIPVDAIKKALAVIKATDRASVDINCDGVIAGIRFEEPGVFPPCGKLFPPAEEMGAIPSIVFDARILGQLAGPKVKGRLPALRMEFAVPSQSRPNSTRPITVTRVGDDAFRGLIMPITPEA